MKASKVIGLSIAVVATIVGSFAYSLLFGFSKTYMIHPAGLKGLYGKTF